MSAFLLALSLGLQVQDADHFPVQAGSEWPYALTNGAEMKVRVSGTANVKGTDCAVVETSFGPQTTR